MDGRAEEATTTNAVGTQEKIPMQTSSSKVIVITGASRGFGRAFALEFARRGNRVVATMRNPDDFESLRAEVPGMDFERLDVTDTASVSASLGAIEARYGRIEVLINNAGYGLYGPVEAFDEEEVIRQFNTNTIGMWRTCKAVLPGMRKRRDGLIINITSGAARIPLPLMGMYSASKAAVHMWSEVLAYEVKRFGIKVTVVEPGAYRTDWQTTSLRVGGTDSTYGEGVDKALAAFREHAATMPDPGELVEGVAKLVESTEPRFHNPIGPEGDDELTDWVLSLTAEQRDKELRGNNPFFPDV